MNTITEMCQRPASKIEYEHRTLCCQVTIDAVFGRGFRLFLCFMPLSFIPFCHLLTACIDRSYTLFYVRDYRDKKKRTKIVLTFK